MSIVPMKKIQLAVHRSAVEPVLQTVQQFGVVEFREQVSVADKNNLTGVDISFPYQHTLPRLQQAISFLEGYRQKPSLWRMLRDGTTYDLSEVQVAQHLENLEVIEPVIEDIELLHHQLTQVQEESRTLRESIAQFKAWEELPMTLAELETARTKTYLLISNQASSELALNEAVAARAEEMELAESIHVTVVSHNRCAITALKSEAVTAALEALSKQVMAEMQTLPAATKNTMADAISDCEAALQTTSEKEATLHAQAENAAKEHLRDLQIKSDVLRWQHDRYAVLANGLSTSEVVVLEGWANARLLPDLEQALQTKDPLSAISVIELDENEEPPVEIENNRLVQPFEVVTRLYGLPGHKDLDPTAFLAGFFFLFFGLSLTDVGYGVFLMIAAAFILFVFKVSDTVRVFGKLLFFMGLASALVGLLFGGYLGIDPSMLPEWLRALQQFDPIGDPLPVFYLALALGVVQVMFGIVLKIVSEARNGRLLGGVLDQGPWLFLFVVLIAYGASSQGLWATAYTTQFLYLIYLGLGAIVITSGRHGKNLFEMVQKSLLSLYDSIGYFSDILSYSRLLALGLATTALAFAVNLIAEIVYDAVPYVGIVFAGLVLVIGHTFTLAVNTLGAFIHSARLQFVEFFGKFISGTGRLFRPFAREKSYVSITPDK